MSTKSTTSSPLESVSGSLSAIFGDRYFANSPIAEHLSCRYGGVAEFLVIAQSQEEIVQAVSVAVKFGIEYCLIGGGTGSIGSEVGFAGLAIVNRTNQINFRNDSSELMALSGTPNAALVSAAASRGLGGIEFLSVIPGSIGGAIATNASFGVGSIGAYLKDAQVLVVDNGSVRVMTLPAAQFAFQPFSSAILASHRYPPVILSVRLQLARLPQDEIIRRMQLLKRVVGLHSQFKSGLGYPLTVKPADLQKLNIKELKKVLPAAVRIEESGLIILPRHNKCRSQDLRQAVEIISDYCRQHGIIASERLRYIGYWPEGGETETQ